MRKLLIALVLFTSSLTAFAQQDYQFTQFFNDRVSLNPGATGMGANCLGLFYRNQWAGFDGGPTTYLLNYHQKVKLLHGGLGITAFNDRLGQVQGVNEDTFQTETLDGFGLTNNAIRINYSYHLPLSIGGTLGLGIGVGYQGSNFTENWLAVDGTEFDDAIPGTDELFTDPSFQNAGSFDANLGVYYKTQKFWAGLSTTHLTAQDLQGDSFEYKNSRHYYFMTGYDADLTSDLKLMPALLVKSDAVAVSADVNVRLMWQNFIWGGVGLRTGLDAVSPMAGLNYQLPGSETLDHSLQVGYSYDATLSGINNYSSGSHEVFVGYCFKIIEPIIKKKHYNPRFL